MIINSQYMKIIQYLSILGGLEPPLPPGSYAYGQTIDYIESLINAHECMSIILCGYYNTSFERKTGQVDYLNDFISRNN